MVIGAFPVAKLGVLAIKQISKPIANIIKERAKTHPFFRQYICMPPAQFYNWMEVKTKMWALNLGKPITVPKLNEAMAIDLGANLLGEFIIFFIGAGILVIEYTRQSINEAKKQEKQRLEQAELFQTLAEMSFRLERQDVQIKEMTRALGDLDSRSIFKWHKEPIREYLPFNPDEPDQTPHAPEQDYKGIYNPKASTLFKALNYLETCVFCESNKNESELSFKEEVKLANEMEKLRFAVNLQ